jgi:hypothetical protein
MDLFDKKNSAEPVYKFVSRNYDVFMPQPILLVSVEGAVEPIVPCLSCVRLKKGNRISIRLLLRFHAAE